MSLPICRDGGRRRLQRIIHGKVFMERVCSLKEKEKVKQRA
jgi:hypothetical protein